MQIGELTAVSLASEFKAECPFSEDESGGPEAASEDVGDDDKDSVEAAQKNDGGVLGDNLSGGKKGKADGGPFPPDDFLYPMPPNDTHRGRGNPQIGLPEFRDAKEGNFPFVVAAHHLIPGNASLKKAESLVKCMTKDGSIESVQKRKYTIKYHIGYDINGAHNGVWLPGNYAIKTAKPERKNKKGETLPAREGTTPVSGISWSALGVDYEPWQFSYVAGACKVGAGQFHDTHTVYSENVLKLLNKISAALAVHLDGCEICQAEGKDKIPPPYRIKRRLFALSQRLRGYTLGHPSDWKKPWFTSDRWSRTYFKGGKVTKEFRMAFAEAKPTVFERPIPG